MEEPEDFDTAHSSDQSGATVIYVTSDKQQQQQLANEKQQQQNKLSGGTGNLQSASSNGSLNPNSASGSPINQRTVISSTAAHALRNEIGGNSTSMPNGDVPVKREPTSGTYEQKHNSSNERYGVP